MRFKFVAIRQVQVRQLQADDQIIDVRSLKYCSAINGYPVARFSSKDKRNVHTSCRINIDVSFCELLLQDGNMVLSLP